MSLILSSNDTVAIIACSNGISLEYSEKLNELEVYLKSLELKVVYANTLYKRYSIFNGSGNERAEELIKLYLRKDIKAIFDVSGGDLANEVLEYIDFSVIEKNYKPFFGYSDLSVLINSIYSLTKKETYLYQVRNLIGNYKEQQKRDFKSTFIHGKSDLFNFNYQWIQGNTMEGIVVGGNIRCLLKLAGTQYMPDFTGKILFLEALSGDVGKITTYLTQYKHLGAFKNLKGIILGSFTEMEKNQFKSTVEELVKKIVNDSTIPIVKTNDIGHGQNSKCLIIGKKINLH